MLTKPDSMPPKLSIILLLISISVITFAIYQNILKHDFIGFDDHYYVTDNPHVNEGFSIDNILWAFSVDNNTAYWHPVTWLSHMLDCQLFDQNAGMHHLTNLLIHILNAILLFIVLHQMTGAIWPSAVVAALFAVHPINVDSVAWIAERKNVLSTLFWMISMLAYFYYTKRPSLYRYILIAMSFSIGLMSKSMLVTLPCVFLLLDFWPLQRLRYSGLTADDATGHIRPVFLNNFPKLILEKLPLLLLSLTAMTISRLSLQNYHQILSTATVPLDLRIFNALVTYVKYIFKILWPQNLSVFYPFPETIPLWQIISASGFLLIATGFILLLTKKAPYLFVGWFWYLGTLVPVSGLIQGGLWPEMADRWLYVPSIGLFIMTSWGVSALLKKFPRFKYVFISFTIIIFVFLGLLTRMQTSHWENSKTLFQHALTITQNNHVAHYILGKESLKENDLDNAVKHFNQALAIKNNYPEAYISLGNAMMEKDNYDKAIDCYNKALWMSINQEDFLYNQLGKAYFQNQMFDKAKEYISKSLNENPKNPAALNNMANILTKMNKPDEAVIFYEKALQLQPEDTEILNNLANVHLTLGNLQKASLYLNQARAIDPKNALTLNNTGTLYFYQNKLLKAEQYYLSAIKIDPEYSDAHFNLAITNSKQGKIQQAIDHYLTVVHLIPDHPAAHKNLADIYFNMNKLESAIHHYQKSLDSAPYDAQTHFNLGIALYRNNDLPASIRHIQRALKIDPDYHQARLALENIRRAASENQQR